MDAKVREEHVAPFHSISEEKWGVLIEQLHNDIPNLSDTEIVTRLAAIVAAIGDGHTRLTQPPPQQHCQSR